MPAKDGIHFPQTRHGGAGRNDETVLSLPPPPSRDNIPVQSAE
jgi:hypothetical protein